MEEFILKDGSITKDRRLDRIPQSDERSKMYRVTAMTTERQPINKIHLCTTFLDQGTEGACPGFGCSHALLAEPKQIKRQIVTAKFARETVYWGAQKIDPWPGGSYPGADPFYEGSSVLAAVQVLLKLGFINGYYHAFSFTDLVIGVCYVGPPVVGVNWYTGMQEVDKDGFIHVTGELVGGHCLIISGINWFEEYFLLHNSWGKRWGIQGQAKISFVDVAKLMNQHGDFIFFS